MEAEAEEVEDGDGLKRSFFPFFSRADSLSPFFFSFFFFSFFFSFFFFSFFCLTEKEKKVSTSFCLIVYCRNDQKRKKKTKERFEERKEEHNESGNSEKGKKKSLVRVPFSCFPSTLQRAWEARSPWEYQRATQQLRR